MNSRSCPPPSTCGPAGICAVKRWKGSECLRVSEFSRISFANLKWWFMTSGKTLFFWSLWVELSRSTVTRFLWYAADHNDHKTHDRLWAHPRQVADINFYLFHPANRRPEALDEQLIRSPILRLINSLSLSFIATAQSRPGTTVRREQIPR